jgi:hypothetical protein
VTAPARTVLAAIGTGDAVASVLDIALRVGEVTNAAVEAVHVADGRDERIVALALRAGVPLRHLTGPAAGALLGAMDVPGVLAMVIGAGLSSDGHPVGPTARHVLERARKPVAVVPTNVAPSRALRRLLVPLEGSEASSRPILEMLFPLLATEVEVVVLHVFTDTTLPRMLDRPERDLELLGREFLAHHCPPATRVELLPGPVAARVSEVSAAHGADMVVLSWSQDSSEGRAQVVREVLGASALPVLLLPLAPGRDAVSSTGSAEPAGAAAPEE